MTKQTSDWTGYVMVRAESGQRLLHSADWTGQPIVSSEKDRRGQRDKWIGPGILAMALTYVGLVWWLSRYLGTLLGGGWGWVQPVTMGCGVTIVPLVGFFFIMATAEPKLALSPDLQVTPDVAASWQVLDNGRRYIFYLRDDVFWSDGRPVTAHFIR